MPSLASRLGAIVLLLVCAGCAAPPPPPVPPTVLTLRLRATADINPAPDGQGAPVTLRLYQLETPLGFGDAEFYALYKQDAQTLGTDLVKRMDVVLAPDESRSLTLQPDERAHALGVLAAYSDATAVRWRGVAEIPPHKTTVVAITAGRAGIEVQAAPAATVPAPAAGGS